MKRDGAYVTWNEACRARERYVEFFGEPSNAPKNEWLDWLGLEQRSYRADARIGTAPVYELPPQAAQRIKMLNSPHWKTLVKALEVQKQ